MDSLLNQDTDIIEWLNILIRNPETAEQDLSALSIKLQLIEQDLELTLDYQSYSAHTIIQSLKTEIDSIYHQTLELIQESQEISKTLSNIYSPEIFQLQQDHQALSTISMSKAILKEIENLDSLLIKTTEMTRSNTVEAVNLIQQLFIIYERINGIAEYNEYKEKIEAVFENFDQTLTEICFEACVEPNLNMLKKVRKGFESFGNIEKFNELVYVCRLEGMTLKEFDCSVEGFEELSQVLSEEIKIFKEILNDWEKVLNKFIHNFLVKIKFLQTFNSVEINVKVETFPEFLKLAKMIKAQIGSIKCLEDFYLMFTRLVDSEKNILNNMQKIFVRPVSLDSWQQESQQIMLALEESWNRTLALSFATCGFDWSKMSEDIIVQQVKILNSNYSEITNMPLDLTESDLRIKFSWTQCNKFLDVFEVLLSFYNSLEDLSVKCRNSYLLNMTTSYFSSDMEVNKEIQAGILRQSESIMKNNAGFIGFLREGGVFFAKSLESIEKELEIYKGYTEKMLMAGISPEINAYSDLEAFKSPTSPFSVSPSAVITRCGEHLLEILQFLTPKNEELYEKAFLIVFATKPPGQLPHSVASHFWVMAFVTRFLKTFIMKITKIQGITVQGKKQLAADVEYLYNIINALGLFKQDDIAFGQNLLVLRQKLASGQVDDLGKIKNYF